MSKIVEASRFTDLKARVKKECQRRSHTGSITSYGDTTWDYTTTPMQGQQILEEHYEKIVIPLRQINTDGMPSEEGDRVISDEEMTLLEAKLTNFEKTNMTNRNSSANDCASSCTGACYSGCYSTCTGCSGCSGCSGCGSGCADSCFGTCSGGCKGSCKGSCTGGCTSCTSCTGGCSRTCTTTCGGNGCVGACTTSCYQTAAAACTCASGCGDSCSVCSGTCSGANK